MCDIIANADAALAHLVERHLAKVEVASSSLVGRSTKPIAFAIGFFICGYGGIGRHAGFRFPWETVQVQVLLPAPERDSDHDTIRVPLLCTPPTIKTPYR